MEDSEPQFSKPSFDGRLEYFKVLKQYMMNIAQASSMADFVMWYRMLTGMYAVVAGFIKPIDAEKIKKKLNNAKGTINTLGTSRPNNSTLFTIDHKLQEITEELYMASKHLLLPLDTESEEDFSEESFLEGSE